MSEQEKKSGGGAGSSVVLVEQTSASRHKQPYRPVDMQEEAPHDSHHKRSKAPAVPSVAEELKDNVNSETKDRKESERAMSSEKHKHSVAKKLSTSSKRRGSSPETITMAQLEVESKRGATPPQPIPAQVSSVTSAGHDLTSEKRATEKKDDEDSITEEIAELRTPEVAKETEGWSDDEEAGGLPRSESRASRVSRAVRQLFCCGVRLEAPSEHYMSPRGYTDGI